MSMGLIPVLSPMIRGVNVVGQELTDDKYDCAQSDEHGSATILKVGEREHCEDSDHGAEVGDNIEQSQKEADEDSEFESDEPEAHCEDESK